jgi:3-methylcrotonyl-CoA carboxylase alpha subunit
VHFHTPYSLVPTHNIWKAIGYWRAINKLSIHYDNKDCELMFRKNRDNSYMFTVNDQSITAKIEFIDKGEIDVSFSVETLHARSLQAKSIFAKISDTDDNKYKVVINGEEFLMSRADFLDLDKQTPVEDKTHKSVGVHKLLSPLPGRVFKLNFKEGDKVNKGDVVLIIDAMKMENNILAAHDALIRKIHVSLNEMVEGNAVLVELEDLVN